MLKRSLLVLALIVGGVGCPTKRNPAVCCVTEAQCTEVGLPLPSPCEAGFACDGIDCVEAVCARAGDCFDPTLPFCVEGFCVACDSAGDLGCDASQPVCDDATAMCTGCATTDDCASHPGTPICDPSGACIACVGPDDCENPSPVCDTGACRGCELDSECASSVCDAATGACLEPSAVIYVATTGVDAGSCSDSSPCATPEYGLAQLTASRSHLLLAPGTYVDGHTSIAAGVLAVIHGRGASWDPQPPSVSGSGGAGLNTSGSLRIIGLQLPVTSFGPAAVALRCNGGALALEDVVVTGELTAIVGLNDCAITVVNSRLTTRGAPADPRAVVVDGSTLEVTGSQINGGFQLSGVDFTLTNNLIERIGFTISASHGTASFNTIVNTTLATGAARTAECTGTAPPRPTFSENVIWAPTGSATTMFTGTCGVHGNLIGPLDYAGEGDNFNADPRFLNAGGGNFHLDPASPAVDIATSGPATDVDGDARPQGALWDLGFDEVTP